MSTQYFNPLTLSHFSFSCESCFPEQTHLFAVAVVMVLQNTASFVAACSLSRGHKAANNMDPIIPSYLSSSMQADCDMVLEVKSGTSVCELAGMKSSFSSVCN